VDNSGASTMKFSWNVPNLLTILRVGLVPVFVVLLSAQTVMTRWVALATFVIASITDHYDGSIARKRNLVTDFGKIADSFADKLLTGAAFIMFSFLGELPWWVTIVILIREWGITIMRFAMVKVQVMAAGLGGKAKMVLQILGIMLLLVPWIAVLGEEKGGVLVLVSQAVIYLATALTVITGIDYVIKAVKISRRHRLNHEVPGDPR